MSTHAHHVPEPVPAEVPVPAARSSRGPVASFVLHFVEMIVAMVVGMMLLGPVLDALFSAAAGTDPSARPETDALVMATAMTLGMSVWMVHRGHRRAPVLEMAAAMYAPFLAGLIPYWAGIASAETVPVTGHLLMPPAMLLAMLARRQEYVRPSCGGAPASAAGRFAHALSHRWPTLFALGLTFDSWASPGLPPALLLVALGAENLVIGLVRRQFADRRLLAAHIAGFACYAALAGTAVAAGGQTEIVLVAAGWLLHTAWDGALYRANKVVWRWYAEACAVIDLVLGVTILFCSERFVLTRPNVVLV